MRKVLLMLILLAYSHSQTFAHKGSAERIEDRPLTWDDYKHAQGSSGLTVALTHSRIELDSVEIKDDGTIPVFNARCYFMADRSWVDGNFIKTGREEEKEHILKHEQTHYDIARIATEEINYTLNNFNYDKTRVGEQADSIFRSLSVKLRNVQRQYDAQTEHSRIYEEQHKWNKLVADCMSRKRLPEL